MRNKTIFFSTLIIFIFIITIFYKGLSNSNLYTPKTNIEKKIPEFSAKIFFEKKNVSSKNIFNQDKFYLFNIWASWCIPCKEEHPILIDLSKHENLEIIGLNYKDDFQNAQKFISDMGNPYSKILSDRAGTKAIEWGAFGVPETFLIYENKIIKRFIGPLDLNSMDEIKKYIK